MFSLCSHQVPNVFPKMFPIVLHPISFALNSTCNYTSIPKEEIPTYLFWVCLKFDELFLVIGQSKMPITKGKKKSTLVVSTTNEYELPQDTTQIHIRIRMNRMSCPNSFHSFIHLITSNLTQIFSFHSFIHLMS